MKHSLAFATLASCVAALCHAAGPPVPESLLACSRIQDPLERVKCYDTQIETMKAQAASTASAPASAPGPALATTPAPSAPAAASPGGTASEGTAPPPPRSTASAAAAPQPRPPSPSVSAPQPGEAAAASAAGTATESSAQSAAKFGSELLPPGERPTPAAKDLELVSQITGLQLVRSNMVSVSLANGQVWVQELADPKALFFRIGQGAHIEKGTLGSYHLWTADVGEKNWVRVRRVR